MTRHHIAPKVRRLDLFKLIITILLLLPLIVQFNLRSRSTSRVSPLISTAGETAEATNKPGDAAKIKVGVPTLTSPPTSAELSDSDSINFLSPSTEPDVRDPVVAKTGATSLSQVSPVVEMAAPRIIFPADGADILLGELTLIGTGEPESAVEILDNRTMVDISQVSGQGEWRFTFEPEEGIHQFTVRTVADEATTHRVITVMVVNPSDAYDCSSNPGLNRGDDYIVGTCDTLCAISQRLEISCEALIAANPQVENPDLVFPGQILNIP